MGRRLFVLVSCTMMAVALALFCEGQQPGRKFALLVGVNQYKHPDLTKLRFSENDVTDLAKVLQDGGYQVTLLRGNEATKAKIEERLGEILNLAERGDSVVVAFAGHGLQFADQKDGYFCPVEAKPFTDEITTLVSLEKIYKDMQRSYADVKVLLVDACRNDGSRGTRGVGGDNAPRPPRGVAAYFSCAAGQVAYEHEKFQHGVFFHFVLEGLRGQAKNGRDQVTFSSLVDYVSTSVAETVPELVGGGAKQSPNFKADLEGASPVLLAGSLSSPADFTNSIAMRLVRIPAGKFTMGSPNGEVSRDDDEIQHDVEITQAFYIGAFEVTQAQYEAVMGKNPSYFCAAGEGRDRVAGMDTRNFPVENVTWEDAVEFCRKLSARADERNAGRVYELPTEAEWEYACRARSTTVFHYGNSLSARQANIHGDGPYGGAAKEAFPGRPTKVGSYQPNAFGLYDMHGNVWECCADWYGHKYDDNRPTRDPKGPQTGEFRILRGGSWNCYALICRAADRCLYRPVPVMFDLGFRVVCRVPARAP